MAIGERLRAKVLREVRVWGLAGIARVEGDGGTVRVTAQSERDANVAEGFAAAATSMLPMDLERRLWSGRIAEFLGERTWSVGTTAVDLDLFVRILGFRHRAERMFRRQDEKNKAVCEGYARGVNAWIDAGGWKRDRAWTELGTQPRLWGPADCLLLAHAGPGVDVAGPDLQVTLDASARGWTTPWDQRTRELWAALHHDRLRAHGGLGAGAALAVEAVVGGAERTAETRAGVPSLLRAEPTGSGRPEVLALEIVEGGDNHQYVSPTGLRRLKARRIDLEIHGAVPRRHWVRRTQDGGLISDLLRGASDALAPAGVGFEWRWSTRDDPGSDARPRRAPLPKGHPWRVVDRRYRKVPSTKLSRLDEGA